ncbi:MAG: plasmid pRiA4b ORF-3 family protein [Rhodothermales bacterium]
MAPTFDRAYQLKVSLSYVNPPVWRRFFVRSSIELEVMHRVLQTVMGWTNSHLHHFIVGETFFGVPDPEWGGDVNDESGVPFDSVLREEGQSILYEYDFGDGWMHTVLLEKILEHDADLDLPKCIAGKRNCPPEDVGGPPGYAAFLQAYLDRKHPAHQDMVDWAGEGFDPELFDLDEVNEMLAEGDHLEF